MVFLLSASTKDFGLELFNLPLPVLDFQSFLEKFGSVFRVSQSHS